MRYTSNAKTVLANLQLKLSKISGQTPSEYSVDKVVRTVALEIYASNLRRIHNEGKDVNEAPIGKYSTKTTLIGSSSFINKGTVDKVFGSRKSKDLKWRTLQRGGKNVHLALLSGGYKKIRELDGYETSKVNLQRTGRLLKDYAVNSEGKDWVVGFTSEYGSKISDGQEEHFNTRIWGVSRRDSKIIDTILTNFRNQFTNA